LPFRDTKNRSAPHRGGIPLIRAGVLAPTLAFLRRIGAPLERLVERANLRIDHLEDTEVFVPLVFANRLLESAARESGVPDLGIEVSRHVDPLDLGTYGRLMGQSGTLGRALELSGRLKPAWNSGARVWLTRRGAEIELHHRFVAARGESWEQSVAVNLMLHLNLLHAVTAGRWRPRRIRLPVAASRVYRDVPMLADARMEFGAPWTTITFPASLFALPLPRSTAPTPIVVPPFEAPPQEFAGSVRTLVTSLLGAGYPSIGLVADAAGMSLRTFQRRLSEKGVTYDDIITEVRLAEAARSLVDSDRKVVDIAFELGYSDHAHFTRAFRRWTGLTPFEFRQAYRDREPIRARTGAAQSG
jgi:AraC-like DNA-binding protein